MKEISLSQIVPEVFSQREKKESGIWYREVAFTKGEVCLLEAVSGAGKSSLCSYLYGYRSDYQGTICFDGENIRNFSKTQWAELRRVSLSILFQELRLFQELTAWENILIKNNLTGYKPLQWIENCFHLLGIEDKKDVTVAKLSFGQQQRIAFVRALCQPFDFVFLDEPVSHLDINNNRILGELLAEEVKQQGAGVIVTSIGNPLNIKYDKIMQL